MVSFWAKGPLVHIFSPETQRGASHEMSILLILSSDFPWSFFYFVESQLCLVKWELGWAFVPISSLRLPTLCLQG